MRKYIILILLIIVSLLQQCKKPQGDDLSGEFEIHGVLVLNDTLKGITEETILKNNFVEIKTDPASDAFLFKVKTDSAGTFTFTNLSNQTYYLYAETKTGSVLFTDTLAINPQTDKDKSLKLQLQPVAPDYNILSIITKDSTATPVSLLNNVNICIFKTRQLAEEGNCASAVWTGTTDKNGRTQFTGLAESWYYISATFTAGNVNLVKKDSVFVTATKISQKTVYLNKPVQSLTFTGEVFINDTLWGISEEVPLANQVVLLKKESERNQQNFLQQATSNDRGVFAFTAVSPGVYSLQASKITAGVQFADTVTIQSAAYSKIVLFPAATTYNILQVIVKDDATNGLLNNATVCIFNSRQLAESNDCAGAMISQPTNQYGRFVTSRLPLSKYYINAQLTVGNKTLAIKDSVLINNNTGIIQKTIWLK